MVKSTMNTKLSTTTTTVSEPGVGSDVNTTTSSSPLKKKRSAPKDSDATTTKPASQKTKVESTKKEVDTTNNDTLTVQPPVKKVRKSVSSKNSELPNNDVVNQVSSTSTTTTVEEHLNDDNKQETDQSFFETQLQIVNGLVQGLTVVTTSEFNKSLNVLKSAIKLLGKRHSQDMKMAVKMAKKTKTLNRKRSSEHTTFNKPVFVKESICELLELPKHEKYSRKDIRKMLQSYIKDHKLNNPENGKFILYDEALYKALDLDKNAENVSYFSIQALFANCFYDPDAQNIGSLSK